MAPDAPRQRTAEERPSSEGSPYGPGMIPVLECNYLGEREGLHLYALFCTNGARSWRIRHV